MNTNTIQKFMSAVESADIDVYQFDVDDGFHYLNNETSFCIVDEENEQIINVRRNQSRQFIDSEQNIAIHSALFEDIHQARAICANYSQAEKFLTVLGVTMTDDQKKILLNIDKGNINLIPVQEDYNSFKPLTQEQYDKLTEEEKEKYDKEKQAYEDWKLRRGLTQKMAIVVET